jgi:hypothetical protein
MAAGSHPGTLIDALIAAPPVARIRPAPVGHGESAAPAFLLDNEYERFSFL